MGKIITMGEVLVDFIGSNDTYTYNPGGAPANVASCVAHLGMEATIISRVGDDIFGQRLIDDLKKNNVDISNVIVDKEHNTSLAFVSNNEFGERSFSFFRKNAADLYMECNDIGDIFHKNDIFHFCSVDLKTLQNRRAHKKAIEKALENRSIISFDPNLRFNLWENHDELKTIVNEFIPFAHILKISEDELEFINGDNNLSDLLRGNVKILIITKGEKGSMLLSHHEMIETSAYDITPVDTTGAGDSFIGAFLYCLLRDNVSLSNLLKFQNRFSEYLDFASQVSAYVCTKKGALGQMPSLDDLKKLPVKKK